MNVSEIQARVKRQFGDESSVQVTDDDIYRWINDAQKEIAVKNHLLETKKSADAVGNQAEYTLPVDILELRSVRYDSVKVTSVTMQEYDEYIGTQNLSSTNPLVYHIYENTMIVWPIPPADFSNAISIYYTRMPVEVTASSDVPELAVKYHNRIVEYCLQQAYELDEDFNASQVKASQFTVGVNEQLESESWATRDFYPTIMVLPEDL